MYNKPNYSKFLFWMSIIIFILSAIIDSHLNNVPFTFSKSIKYITLSVTISSVINFCLKKWWWKFKIFKKWLVLVPDLNGEWSGTLNSTYEGATHPINIKLIIRQNFDSIKIESRTGSLRGISITSDFKLEHDGEVVNLYYIFDGEANKETRDGNPSHKGSVNLEVFQNPSLYLEGEYWTNRETSGSLKLERVNK